MKAMISSILAAALFTVAGIANAAEPVKLSSTEMDRVTAGQNLTRANVREAAFNSTLNATAIANAIDGPNVAIGGNVRDSGDTKARANARNF